MQIIYNRVFLLFCLIKIFIDLKQLKMNKKNKRKINLSKFNNLGKFFSEYL